MMKQGASVRCRHLRACRRSFENGRRRVAVAVAAPGDGQMSHGWIFRHDWRSPLSRKVPRHLAMKRLRWHSVAIPELLGEPDLLALTRDRKCPFSERR
jgi:hypothetical protein